MKLDINKLTQTMGKITEEMQAIQNKIQVEATALGGTVKVVADGNGTVKSISIDPELVKAEHTDIEMLQDFSHRGG